MDNYLELGRLWNYLAPNVIRLGLISVFLMVSHLQHFPRYFSNKLKRLSLNTVKEENSAKAKKVNKLSSVNVRHQLFILLISCRRFWNVVVVHETRDQQLLFPSLKRSENVSRETIFQVCLKTYLLVLLLPSRTGVLAWGPLARHLWTIVSELLVSTDLMCSSIEPRHRFDSVLDRLRFMERGKREKSQLKHEPKLFGTSRFTCLLSTVHVPVLLLTLSEWEKQNIKMLFLATFHSDKYLINNFWSRSRWVIDLEQLQRNFWCSFLRIKNRG